MISETGANSWPALIFSSGEDKLEQFSIVKWSSEVSDRELSIVNGQSSSETSDRYNNQTI
jgi:hypothetical protein